MISLVLSMIWFRRGQAMALGLLAMLAVTAAVAAPAYLAAAERAVAQERIASAPNREKSVAIRFGRDPSSQEFLDFGPGVEGITFPEQGQSLLRGLPGFTFHYSVEVQTVGLEAGFDSSTRLVFRQDVCAHVRLVTGRCLVGEGDALIGADTARRLRLTVGDSISLNAATIDRGPPQRWVPAAEPKVLTVAGVYQPLAPGEPYWGQHGYFVVVPGASLGEPVLTTAATLDTMVRTVTDLQVDGVAGPAALDIDQLGRLRADLARLQDAAAAMDETVTVDTRIPDLLDRIHEDRAAARLLVPVLAAPLVLLACLTIYLVVGYGSAGRQPELAVVALRGTRWSTRWWLATGEIVLAVLAGSIIGCLTGQLLVNGVAAVLMPGAGTVPALASLQYAPLAAVAALTAAVAAQRRQFVGPVTRLLRRSPATDRRRLPAAEVVVVVLAVAAGAQYVLATEPLTGIGLFAPALIMISLALLAARILLPAVSRVGARALRRGSLATAVAGLQLARRPGTGRLFALLIAATAVAGYAACTVDTANRGRDVTASLQTGADRILIVSASSRRELLGKVRAVDPQGRFAMAVVRIPQGSSTPPGLAVDTRAIGSVPFWPAGTDPDGLAALVRPQEPGPAPVYPGPDLALEVTASVTGTMRVALSVSSADGATDQIVPLGALRPGTHTYRTTAPMCAGGCRLNGIGFSGTGSSGDSEGHVVIRGAGGAAALPTDLARWRADDRGRLSAESGGLRADLAVTGAGDVVWVQPATTPYPLPVGYAGTAPTYGAPAEGGPAAVPFRPAVAVPVVPGIGREAVLLDLEYSDLIAYAPQVVSQPEVWLNAGAPADVVEQLDAQGLRVVAESSTAAVADQLDRQGPAVALRFHVLAAVLAALLGAGALVLTVAADRVRRTEDLAAMRVQGLSSRTAGLATLWTYPVMVSTAIVVGLLVAVAAWWVTGGVLPLAGITPPDLPLPSRPRAVALLVAGGVAMAMQFLAAFLAGWSLRRRVEGR